MVEYKDTIINGVVARTAGQERRIHESSKGAAEKAAPTPDTPSFNFVVSLHGDMAKYGPDIRRFVEAMIYKLEKNVTKGKWEDLAIERAFKLLEGEVDELRAEVHGDRNMVRTMLEAADVANFALIVASIAMERGR